MMGQLSLEQMEMEQLRQQVADLSARLDTAQVMILERDAKIAELEADLDAISKAFRLHTRPPTTGT